MSLKNDKVIIEMYGLPGSGKSTLARNIAAEYGFSHVTAVSVSRGEYVTLFLCYPYTVLCWLSLISKNFFKVKSIKHLRYNVSLLFVSLKKIRLANKCAEARVVIDEGLVQRFLSYSDIILTEKEIGRLLAVSPLGHVLVLVNDREVTQDRYDEAHDRGSLGLERLHEWRRNMSINILNIKGILENNKKISSFDTKSNPVNDILQKINTNAV